MRRGCTRWCSSSSAAQASKQPNPGRSIRDVLGDIRTQRQSGSPNVTKQAFDIRKLVKSRSKKFRDELSQLSEEEYKHVYLRHRLQSQFKGSTQELLKDIQGSPKLQAEYSANLPADDFNNDQDVFEDYDDITMDEYSGQSTAQPGDLVEYWPDKGLRKTCLVLRLPASEKHFTCLGSRGSIDYVNPNRFRFVLPGFYDGTKLPSEGLLKEGDRILAPALHALKSFKNEVDQFATANARDLESVYERLPERLRLKSSVVSLSDICQHLYNSTDAVKMYALFEAITKDRMHFLPDAALLMNVPYFTTRPLDEVNNLKRVRHWTRARSTEYKSFIKRATKVAAFGKSLQKSAELKLIPCPIHFTDDDQLFIQFMLKACLERKDHPEIEIYTTTLASIVKDLDLVCGQTVERAVVHQTLKSLGILAPWDANLLRNATIAMPGTDAARVLAEHNRYLQNNFAQNQVESLSRLGLADTTHDIRHDFGDLPVYTIDGEGSRELDDGLSIDGDWLHIHIADPSSFISPQSKLAEIARHRVETTYLTDHAIPMLPSNLVQAHFSLGAASASPTVTTSIKLTASGEISELLIRPAVVRNVINTTYDIVDHEVFQRKPESRTISSLSVNWHPDTSDESLRTKPQLSPQDVANIKAIGSRLQLSFQNRLRHGMIDSFNNNRTTSLWPDPMPIKELDYEKPAFFTGRPGIAVSVTSVSESPATALVTEAALLTNSANARYAHEQGIPVIYRVMQGVSHPKAMKDLLAARDEKGRVQMHVMKPFMAAMGATQMSLTHGPATLLGLPEGYMHATSPLRRFTDMVAQWQLQAFLTKRRYPIDLEKLLPDIVRRGRALKLLDKSSRRHWIVQLLQQKLELGESLEFRATVTSNNPQPKFPSDAMLHGIGERCLIERLVSDPVPRVGSSVALVVVRLDLMDNVIYTRRTDL